MNRQVASAGDAFELWGHDVFRLIRFVGVPERVAADATHDVFVVAHCRWDSFRGKCSRKTWLFGIALNVARNYRRRHARPGEDPALALNETDTATGLVAAEEDPFERTARAELAGELQGLLDELPTLARQLVVLTQLQELSVVDAAALLQLSERSARRLLRKSCSQMEAALRRKARDAWRDR